MRVDLFNNNNRLSLFVSVGLKISKRGKKQKGR